MKQAMTQTTKNIKQGLFFLITVLFLSPLQAEVRLSQVQTYLNDLKTLQADFKQWDSNGTLTTGKLYLQRPGHIRMNYQDPSKLVILADGETLFFVDTGTGDLSHTPIGQSPAAFLLDKTISLTEGFKVEEFSVKDNRIKLTIRREGDSDLGALTLVFQKSPKIQLIQWIIIDGQDKKTIINLEGITTGHKLDSGLFNSEVLFK